MKVAPEFARAVAFAAAVSLALNACSSSDKAPATASKDSGAGGEGTGGATAIFTGPDAANNVHLGDAAAAACGGFGRATPACVACLKKSCCDPATACAKTTGCPQNAACIQACDGTSGPAGDACRQACADKYFVSAGTAYNGLSLCMSNSCKTECPFSGP
jgi:hypothetical protein